MLLLLQDVVVVGVGVAGLHAVEHRVPVAARGEGGGGGGLLLAARLAGGRRQEGGGAKLTRGGVLVHHRNLRSAQVTIHISRF